MVHMVGSPAGTMVALSVLAVWAAGAGVSGGLGALSATDSDGAYEFGALNSPHFVLETLWWHRGATD